MSSGNASQPPTSGWPLPYSGHRIERRARLGTSYVVKEQDSDRTGKVHYAFNALGFRGSEFQPSARFKVFVFGESTAFGLGVEHDESWTSQLARMLAEDRGVRPEHACCLNFAESGASNSHIARLVVTQCSAVRPDFVIVQLAEMMRTECYAEDTTFPVGQWLQHPATEQSVLGLPATDPQRARLLDFLRRGRCYLEFTSRQHAALDALRNALLVQCYLALHRIPYVMAVPAADDPTNVGDGDAVLTPLVSEIDQRCYVRVPFEFGITVEDESCDQHHIGSQTHAAVARFVHGVLRRRTEQHPESRTTPEPPPLPHATPACVAETVRTFYETSPFNLHGTVEEAAAGLRRNPLPDSYPDLHSLLQSGAVRRVLEFGCGTGWLASVLALHYGATVTAVDFTPRALARARDVAATLGTDKRIRFQEHDLFTFDASEPADLVVSLGVLHHTGAPEQAFRRVQRFARDQGFLYVGLYHGPGRRAFLDYFQTILAREGNEAAFARFRELDRVRAADESLARSWFLDQVLHPHESLHTLREVCRWMDSLGLELRSTSINRFGPVTNLPELFVQEQEYAEIARRAICREGRFFPGFFTFLCQRSTARRPNA